MENKSMDDILQEITSMDHLLGKSNRILDLPERESLTNLDLLAALDIASKSQILSPPDCNDSRVDYRKNYRKNKRGEK